MKIRIELDDSLQEQEIIIRAPELTPEISQLQKLIGDATKATKSLEFYKGDTRVYISTEEVLFFETDEKGISAHTGNDRYEIRYKLYELEQMLPSYFMRVSKSTILNIREIFTIDRSLYASSVVSFRDTHKQVFVSRHYYKTLTERLESKA
ncbi:MAG: LytTR family transcriptional regulator DNA-binding domain-containing protein [Lachnospiraceae bacterium]|nr:LytTR family transcriptional regulator DNA-binding domain-containing protein [Lachnospiraceae bacterium]MBR3635045.1 LytTR family transcriptional regulator DNA-binding domain-containing protein [Lachnospiraceae bacterium]